MALNIACGDQFTSSELLFEQVSAYATVGLSLDVTPQLNTAAKLIITINMYMGRIGSFGFFMAFMSGSRKPKREGEMNNKLPKSNMRQVAVLGLGRFGTELTKALYNSGCEVLAVDQNEDRIYEIADNATHAVATNVAEESNLRQIGITEFDGVVIAIGDNIQASIITALNCKEMGCNYIVAKAQNAKHARVLEKIGGQRGQDGEAFDSAADQRHRQHHVKLQHRAGRGA